MEDIYAESERLHAMTAIVAYVVVVAHMVDISQVSR